MQSPQAQPDPACLSEERPEPVEVDKACYSHKTAFQVLVQSWHFCKYLSRGEAGPALGFEIRLIRCSGHKLVKEKSGFSWATVSDSCRSGNSNPPMTPFHLFWCFPHRTWNSSDDTLVWIWCLPSGLTQISRGSNPFWALRRHIPGWARCLGLGFPTILCFFLN